MRSSAIDSEVRQSVRPGATKRDPRLGLAAGHFRGSFNAMGSPCELLLETADEVLAQELLQIVATEAWRVEDKFSRYRSDNVVARINQSNGRPLTVDDETANLLEFAATLYQLSDGRFDITSGVLRKAWLFDGSDRVPDADSIAQIMGTVGWHRVSWRRPEIQLLPGMQIDFGGIGKEYAVDRAAGLVSRRTNCPCLVNFGGDLVAVGGLRHPDGWQVGVETPGSNASSAQKLILLKHGALATSGDSRRFLLKDGIRYGHILDPMSGWPVECAPRSVTVAADSCTQAGMFATLAMLCGKGAEEFLEDQGVRFWCLR
ncbi:MAG: FAD:protein FMN transferase [Gammaproteobacteria bacterium]|nr:FAD:protein FMN transferase [Gammaproteobacteria bacterium]MDH4314865.1 FAD:protein FMN transferase [Gammaproteobacteria bacterium]